MLFISIPAGSPLRNTVLIKQALKLLYSSQALYRSVSEAKIPSPVLFPLLGSSRIYSDPSLLSVISPSAQISLCKANVLLFFRPNVGVPSS